MTSSNLQNFTSLFGVTPMSHKVRSRKVRKTNFMPSFGTPKQRILTERDLLRMESAIGASMFGKVALGHQREFFCLDERTWVWYESWVDAKRVKHDQTTRYEIHSNGVVKVQPDKPYFVLEGEELENFNNAMQAYHDKVMNQLYADTNIARELHDKPVQTTPLDTSMQHPDTDSQLEETKNREYIQNIYSDSRIEKTDQTTTNTLQ